MLRFPTQNMSLKTGQWYRTVLAMAQARQVCKYIGWNDGEADASATEG